MRASAILAGVIGLATCSKPAPSEPVRVPGVDTPFAVRGSARAVRPAPATPVIALVGGVLRDLGTLAEVDALRSEPVDAGLRFPEPLPAGRPVDLASLARGEGGVIVMADPSARAGELEAMAEALRERCWGFATATREGVLGVAVPNPCPAPSTGAQRAVWLRDDGRTIVGATEVPAGGLEAALAELRSRDGRTELALAVHPSRSIGELADALDAAVRAGYVAARWVKYDGSAVGSAPAPASPPPAGNPASRAPLHTRCTAAEGMTPEEATRLLDTRIRALRACIVRDAGAKPVSLVTRIRVGTRFHKVVFEGERSESLADCLRALLEALPFPKGAKGATCTLDKPAG